MIVTTTSSVHENNNTNRNSIHSNSQRGSIVSTRKQQRLKRRTILYSQQQLFQQLRDDNWWYTFVRLVLRRQQQQHQLIYPNHRYKKEMTSTTTTKQQTPADCIQSDTCRRRRGSNSNNHRHHRVNPLWSRMGMPYIVMIMISMMTVLWNSGWSTQLLYQTSHAYTTASSSLSQQQQQRIGAGIASSSTTTLCSWTNSKRHVDRNNFQNNPMTATSTIIGLRRKKPHHPSIRCATTRTTTTTMLFMGKGDGKQKRAKKTTSSTGSSMGQQQGEHATTTSKTPTTSSSQQQQQQQQQQPLRVSSNINVPVRQQIAIAQMNKIIRQQQQSVISSSSSGTGGGGSGGGISSSSGSSLSMNSKPRIRTAYRRTWEEEEIVQKAEERKRRGQEPNWDVILNRTAVAPLLIVDGYNIIHAWPRLKKHMIKGDPSRARQLLIDDLENLQSIKGWRIECVFDGTRRSTIGPLGSGPSIAGGGSSSNAAMGMANPISRGIDPATKQSVSKYGVRVVFSAVGMEADTYIEGRCLRAKNVTNGAITGSLIVATDDAMIRLSGQNAGAICMRSLRFVEELKAVQKVVAYRVEAAVAKVNGHAIRPEQLRGGGGSHNHVAMPTQFGRRSVVMEDKRNRTKVVRKKDEMIDEEYESYISSVIQQQVEEDENGIPWWAKAPDQSNSNFYKR